MKNSDFGRPVKKPLDVIVSIIAQCPFCDTMPEHNDDGTVVCEQCGVSMPTLDLWNKRPREDRLRIGQNILKETIQSIHEATIIGGQRNHENS